MSTAPRFPRRLLCLLGGLLVVLASVLSPGLAHASSAARPTVALGKEVPLSGDGSSWAQPAIDQFSRDVRSQGVVVTFQGDGSAAGRTHFTEQQNDFAATDIQFLTTGDPFGSGPESQGAYSYSYIPIVAGGTTFMYNLKVGTRTITNLRLSGDTITKIFTGVITDWSDPRITRDYGAQLPHQKITVVTRSDGSGASYQFTRYMAVVYGSQWRAFCTRLQGKYGCGPTEFYPPFGSSIQRPGSDQVADYIANPTGEGSIGYDEYSYAKASNIPVVKLLNAAGYYSLPTASNVAIALQKAQIDENPNSLTFLIQNLDDVYTNPDPRTYPLSSYSYLLVPRTARGNLTVLPGYASSPNKGYTLSHFLNYSLCSGQQKASSLGYSPLPENLFDGGFKQVSHIPGYDPSQIPNPANYNACNNPTYHNKVNYLLKDAPQPLPCDKVTAPLNCSSGGGTSAAGVSGTRGTTTVGKSSGSSAIAGTGPAATGPASTSTGTVSTGSDAGTTSDGIANASAVTVAGPHGANGLLATVAALVLLGAVMVPAGLGLVLRRRGAIR